MRKPKGAAVGWFLLLGLVASLFTVPFLDHHRQFPPLPFTIVMLAFVATAMGVVADRWHGFAVLAMGALGIVILIATGGTESAEAHILPGLLFAVSAILTAGNLARIAMSRRTHGDARIIHGVSAYILIGIAYGLIAQRVELLAPGSFKVTPGHDVPIDGGWADYLWMSFSVMTTSGFATDLVPVSSAARAVCAAEAITGIMFPAIFLARLVTAASEDDSKDCD